ncbi:hypothetical protein PR003_g6263 [Phytophthora rubi]|uniref:Uncharacterized protein n=1 Tax=Phytophthora rubi TaxID=129364 RepID=A0A6A3NBC2_9STRA|nr:hypothetical protein PR002_g5949 [Phytophthora rubi]KAE9348709.1 hypothetical protein PR003_g6263 [Phytophthora rubi]
MANSSVCSYWSSCASAISVVLRVWSADTERRRTRFPASARYNMPFSFCSVPRLMMFCVLGDKCLISSW